jgi:hypothetical protein
LVTIAEAQVPPAAQRLRNHGGWAGAQVIAEAEVPPAAQRLRDDDSSGVALPGGSRGTDVADRALRAG